MRVGDVVVVRPYLLGQKVLHCGTGRYTHAIVASMDPFIIISDDGSMLWSVSWSPADLQPLCQASEEIQTVVAGRLAHWLKTYNDPPDEEE